LHSGNIAFLESRMRFSASSRRARLTRLLTLLLAVAIASPAVAQSKNEKWVATWATALVSRPLPGPRGGGPGPGGAAPAAPAVAVPPGGAPAAGAAPAGPAAGAAPAAPAVAAPAGPPAGPGGGGGGRGFAPPATVNNQTLRQIVHTSIGGSRVRVVLSNVFGTAPVQIGGASVALREQESSIQPSTSKTLLFGGSPTATILAGATLVSDPVDLTLAPLSDLAIDLFVPGDLGVSPSPVTTHNGASQTNYVSEPGNHVGVPTMTAALRPGAWFLIARVEVTAPNATLALVAFGDSITDGARSTTDMNTRWPDVLARRLAARRGPGVAVLNAGISGNRVLGDGAGVSALARFDKDVLMQTGVTHVVVMEGINDIGIARSNPSPSAADLIAGHKQLIERARARGLKIYGATLTPYEGAAYFSPEGEAKRQALNEWIRTSGAYDGVIDMDKATRDPAAPSKFLPAYDSGDHLHPGDAGYKAMGDAVDLALFK
jgi:lysophospholipase L1-like esterase